MEKASADIKAGLIIKGKDSSDTYRIVSVGPMIEYDGEYGSGHVMASRFHDEFDVIQGAAILKVTAESVDCPYCDAYINGFVADPRGTSITCESCDNTFVIDPVAVEF